MVRIKRTAKTKKLKGSVLFTVLVVMICLLVLLITTIGLAEAATRRAYREYNDRQTMSTARSLVDSVIATFGAGEDNEDVGNRVVQEIKSSGHSEVTVNGGADLGDGFGRIDSLVFDRVGTDSEAPGEGNFNLGGSGDMIIKVTATVTQGGVTSTFSQYVTGASDNVNATSSGGGLVALGGFNASKFPGVDANSPAYFGIKSETPLDEMTFGNSNGGALWNLIANAPMMCDTKVRFILGSPYSSGAASGSYINGDLKLKDGNLILMAYGDGTGNIKNNPYLFVNGSITSPGAGMIANLADVYDEESDIDKLADKNNGHLGSPVNIYCKRFESPQNGTVGCLNIFCYDADGTSILNQGKTLLLSWAEVNSGVAGAQGSGVFYTRGNLQIASYNGINPLVKAQREIYVGKDLIVEYNIPADQFGGRIFVESMDNIKGSQADAFKTAYAGKIFDKNSNEYKNNNLIKQFKGAASPGDNMDWDTIEASIESPETARANYYNDEDKFTKSVPNSKLDITGDTIVYWYHNALRYCKLSEFTGTGENGTIVKTVKLNSEGVKSTSGTDFYEITNSGIMLGTIKGNIYIAPSATDAKLLADGLWLNMYNAVLETNNIVIDDSQIKTNFYIPTSMSEIHVDSSAVAKHQAVLNASGSIFTPGADGSYNTLIVQTGSPFIGSVSYYREFNKLKSGTGYSLNLVTYPDLDEDPNNNWQVPNIGFYSSDINKTVLKLQAGNPIITADICMGNSDFYALVGGVGVSNLTYNGKKKVPRVGLIGSLIVGESKEFNNDTSMIYVDWGNTGDSGLDEDPIYRWNILNGFANY